jgi:Arc/MetJ-type ribon-helix-helix transcriptional regulator
MTIQLPESVESSIREMVVSGHFASVDDAMTAAANLLLQTVNPAPSDISTDSAASTPPFTPIWEEFEEIAAGIPDKEWAKLPIDGAEQHDHYIYGTPKRPTST